MDPLAIVESKMETEPKTRKRRSKKRQPEATTADAEEFGGWLDGRLPVIVKYESIRRRGRPRKGVDLTCTACPYLANDHKALTDHVSECHTHLKLHVCTVCGAKFNQKGNLVVHMRIHSTERPYRCSMCDYSAVQKNNLYNHQRTHTKEKPYTCSECDYSAAQMGTLRGHYERRHGVAASMPKGSYVKQHFQCPYCDFACKKLRDLHTHQDTNLHNFSGSFVDQVKTRTTTKADM